MSITYAFAFLGVQGRLPNDRLQPGDVLFGLLEPAGFPVGDFMLKAQVEQLLLQVGQPAPHLIDRQLAGSRSRS
jgi:hypothetical protein